MNRQQQKYTPGPWLYAQEGVTAFNIVKPDGHSVVHLSALLNSTAHTDLEANARAIAAVPDLITTCLRALEYAPNEVEANVIRLALQKAGVIK